MATTTPKVKILKLPLLKFNEIQNKKKKKTKTWIALAQDWSHAKFRMTNNNYAAIYIDEKIVVNILETRTLEEQWTCFNWKHLGGDNFTHSRNMRNDTFFTNLKCKVKKPWWRNSKIFDLLKDTFQATTKEIRWTKKPNKEENLWKRIKLNQ